MDKRVIGVYGKSTAKGTGEDEADSITLYTDNEYDIYQAQQTLIEHYIKCPGKLFDLEGKIYYSAARKIWFRVYYKSRLRAAEYGDHIRVTNKVKEWCLDHFLNEYQEVKQYNESKEVNE